LNYFSNLKKLFILLFRSGDEAATAATKRRRSGNGMTEMSDGTTAWRRWAMERHDKGGQRRTRVTEDGATEEWAKLK